MIDVSVPPVVDDPDDGPLARLHVRWRMQQPTTLLCVGSSTTAGVAASAPSRSWVQLMAARLADAAVLRRDGALPRDGALAAPTGSTPTAPVRVIGAGVPGATAADYLTPDAVRAAATAPHLVIHMVGSNDAHRGVPPEGYVRDVAAGCARLDDAAGTALPHLLVHSYHRADDVDRRLPWHRFGAQLRALAAERGAAFADLSATYRALGVPGDDRHRLMDADRIHQNDAGHALMAELMLAVVLAA